MQLFIRDERTHVYQVSDNITLGELCILIEEREGKPSRHQRLTFNGKNLSRHGPHTQLTKFGVMDNTTLHLYMAFPTSQRCFDFDHAQQPRDQKPRLGPSCWPCLFG